MYTYTDGLANKDVAPVFTNWSYIFFSLTITTIFLTVTDDNFDMKYHSFNSLCAAGLQKATDFADLSSGRDLWPPLNHYFTSKFSNQYW